MPANSSYDEAGHPPEPGAAVHRHKVLLTARPARAGLHPRVPAARLSADLGGPGRRSRSAAAGPRRPRHRHRLRRLQCAVLSDRRPRRDHRGRPQRRAYRADQPEARAASPLCPTTPRSSASSAAPTRARTSPSIRRCCAPPRRRLARLLGRTRARRAPPHRGVRPRLLPPRPARPLHRRRPRGRAALRQAVRRAARRRARSTSSARSSSARSRRCSTRRFVRWLARRPSALYGLGIPPPNIARSPPTARTASPKC